MSSPNDGKQTLLDAFASLQCACDASNPSADERAVVDKLGHSLEEWCQEDWPLQLVTWISGIYMDLTSVLVSARHEARELDLLVRLAALHALRASVINLCLAFQTGLTNSCFALSGGPWYTLVSAKKCSAGDATELTISA